MRVSVSGWGEQELRRAIVETERAPHALEHARRALGVQAGLGQRVQADAVRLLLA